MDHKQGRKVSENSSSESKLPVVGIGSSAGGLEALKRLFANASRESGFAYVVISHMSKNQPSLLPEILQKITDLPVKVLKDEERLDKNTIYINPPGKAVAIYHGRIQLLDQSGNSSSNPIDHFLKSLAIDKGKDCAAVILSGTGRDGTAGISDIKQREGIVIAQDTATAAYEGMPHSAIASGCVDKVADPDHIAPIIETFFNNSPKTETVESLEKTSGKNEIQSFLRKIFSILRIQLGHDFSAYKTSTTLRRINRRMRINQISEYAVYIRYLQKNRAEVSALFQDLLIGVTNFFRDPDSFNVLGDEVLPSLVRQKANDTTIRAWIPGCSTGEEAYSIAILLYERLEDMGSHLNLQVFGTDINSKAIDKARQGIYPKSISSDISETRLARFFNLAGENYNICKSIRDSVIFSTQDLTRDPPFSRLDLLCCRNLLIYLNNHSQKKILPLFHYTLNPGGILMLGSSETVGGFTSLFEPLDKKWKIFKRREIPRSLQQYVDFPAGTTLPRTNGHIAGGDEDTKEAPDFQKITKNLLLEHLDPSAVLIDNSGDVLFVYGRVGRFLEPPAGHPTRNLVDMARTGLRIELSAAIRSAKTSKSNVSRRGVTVEVEGDTVFVDIHVYPHAKETVLKDQLLVVFDKAEPIDSDSNNDKADGLNSPSDPKRVNILEKELQATRESHQCTIEELESSNEELKSTNEELQSANEELQSTNEELESSKEEMQSLNEEMQTVNSELQSKVEELSATHDDMRNLLNSTEVATIFVDNEMLIRRYTSETEKILNIIHSDVGRPLQHVVSNLVYNRMVEDTGKVLRNLTPVEREVQVKTGEWFKMRIIPYRTTENIIAGAVLTFLDIQEQKIASDKLSQTAFEFEQSWDLVRIVFDMNTNPLAVITLEGNIIIANRAMESIVYYNTNSVLGRSFLSLLKIKNTLPAFEENFLRLLRSKKNFKTEKFMVKLNDKFVSYSIHARGISGSDNVAFRYLLRMVKSRPKWSQ